jgi:hypothetical protein
MLSIEHYKKKSSRILKSSIERSSLSGCILISCFLISACSPKIAIETPKEPITINLNVKIEHEILIKVDKQIDDLFNEESDLF